MSEFFGSGIDKRDNRIYEIQRDASMPEISDRVLERLTDEQVNELYKIHWDIKTTFDSTKKEELINRANQILKNAGKDRMFGKTPKDTVVEEIGANNTSSGTTSSGGGASFNPFDALSKFTSVLLGIGGPLLSTLFQLSPLLLFGNNYPAKYQAPGISLSPYIPILPLNIAGSITPTPAPIFPIPPVPYIPIPGSPNIPNPGA